MDKKGKLSSNSLLTIKLIRLLLFIRTWSTMFLVVKNERRKSSKQRLTTVIVGKLNRGISVVDTVRILKGDSVTEDDIFKATVLGWLIEFVSSIRSTWVMKLTFFLVASLLFGLWWHHGCLHHSSWTALLVQIFWRWYGCYQRRIHSWILYLYLFEKVL